MISIEHPSIRSAVANMGYGLLPLHFVGTDKFALIVKTTKEAILTARLNQELKLYLVPDGAKGTCSLGLITAFFDDHDEPLVLFTPMYTGDQLQSDLVGVLSQAAFDVFFFDENHREMMGVRVRVNNAAQVLKALQQVRFKELKLESVGKDLEAMGAWFGRRSELDDAAAFQLQFEEKLYPDDLLVIDTNPEAYDFHGAAVPGRRLHHHALGQKPISAHQRTYSARTDESGTYHQPSGGWISGTRRHPGTG